ncbi:MAG TPA: IS1182 family transposase [Pseudolabrys sp.]
MMGRLNHNQRQFFYSFCLDEAVPDDHLVREIAAVLDLSWVHRELAPFYPKLGRPSIDPELMIRMLIIGYVFAIRSERALCRDVHVNLAYRWLCGLSIEDKVPDHSAFSRARHERFRDSDMFRRVFERVVEACIAAGLVGGEGFAVDASLIVADANKQRSIPGSEWNKTCDPRGASRAMKEYLATLDDAAFGAASEVTPKFVSPSDPAAQWTGAMRGPAFFAYADNYLVDVKFGIIVDVEASRAIRQAEVGAAKTMIERTQERFDLKPEYLAADTAYGSAETLNWIVNEKKIAPHVPVIDKSKREDGTLSRSDFTFDKESNIYICPAGNTLTTTGRIHGDHAIRYFASVVDCRACALKPKCCPNMPSRRIVRDVNEEVRDVARALAKTEAFEQSRRSRKRVEMLFAHLKRILRLGRLRLRGPLGAQDEFTLAAIAQNLRRLAKLVARPPPAVNACVA